MEQQILDLCIDGMKEYNNAQGQTELAEASDTMANSLEEIMILLGKDNPVINEQVVEYFKEKENNL